ncbi:MAG: M56 family metallopeptidase [Planctomycetota bacterium]
MNGLETTALDLLAWLATYAIHSTLLLGAALVATRMLSQPRLRELVWKGALVAALVTTCVQAAAGVGWTFALTPRGSVPERPGELVEGSGGAALTLELGEGVPGGARLRSSAAPAADREAAGVAAPAADRAPAATGGMAWSVWLLAAWLAWAAVGLAQLGRRWLALRRGLEHREPVQSGPLASRMHELRRGLGVARGVRLYRSPYVSSPLALGGGSIVLPSFATQELSRDSQDAMLAHELAHIARRDAAWALLAGVLERLFPFQPLHRVAAARMREEAELLCDERALRETRDPLALARCLMEVAERYAGDAVPALSPSMAAAPSQLVQRVERVLSGETAPPRRRWIALTALAAGATAATVACTAPGVTSTGDEPVAEEEVGAVASGVEPEREPDPDAEAALRALGYVGSNEPGEEPVGIGAEDEERLKALGYAGSPSEPAVAEGAEEQLSALGYLAPAPAAKPVDPAVVVRLDGKGAVSLDGDMLVPAGSNDFEPLYERLAERAAGLRRAETASGLSVVDEALRIRAEAGTDFHRVLRVLEQCGRQRVQIWRTQFDLVDGDGRREVFDIPLPSDVGVHAGPVGEHRPGGPPRVRIEPEREEGAPRRAGLPPRIEVEVAASDWRLLLPADVPAPELDWHGMDPTPEDRLTAEAFALRRAWPGATFSIDTGRRTASSELAAVLRALKFAKVDSILFIAAPR